MVGVYTIADSPQSQHSQTVFAAAARAGVQMVVVESYCVTPSFEYNLCSDAALVDYYDVLRERGESNRRNWKAIQRSHNYHQVKWSKNRPKHR